MEPKIFKVVGIEVDSIIPSPVNKRCFLDNDKSLIQLADSIEMQGLLQPIVVRKNKFEEFEIVAGERRFRAFLLKGWSEIPCVIRELDDLQAHEITVCENLQREDLSPVQEAESIKVLLEDGQEPSVIADKIGKSVSWVLRRSRIADLSPKWLKSISDNKNYLSKWSATHLSLIARYNIKEQDLLLSKEFSNNWDQNIAVITVKELEIILANKLLQLSKTLWDLEDEILIPKSGACSACQKRTSCSPELFDSIELKEKSKGDQCVDRECWNNKLFAFHEIKIKKAKERNKDLLFVSTASYNSGTLPDSHPWSKLLVEHYNFSKCKKDDPDAKALYVVDGPGVGKIKYMKPYSSILNDRPKDEDGKVIPKTLKERQKGLLKRRTIRFFNKLILILNGENSTNTDTKKEKEQPVDDELLQAFTEEKKSALVKNLSSKESHALIAAFGATSYSAFNDYDFNRWNVFNSVLEMDDHIAMQTAIYGSFEKICDSLRSLCCGSDPKLNFGNNLCASLNLDTKSIWAEILKEIPEPKSWNKLKEENKK